MNTLVFRMAIAAGDGDADAAGNEQACDNEARGERLRDHEDAAECGNRRHRELNQCRLQRRQLGQRRVPDDVAEAGGERAAGDGEGHPRRGDGGGPLRLTGGEEDHTEERRAS